MGRHFWGSRAQEATLFHFKKEYETCRRLKKTRKFWPRFFSYWFATYSEDRLIKRTRMTQCKTWMANHTGIRDNGAEGAPPDGAPDDDAPDDDAPDDDAPDDGTHPPYPAPPPPPQAPGLNRRARRRLKKASRESKILALIRGYPKRYKLPLHQAYSHLHYDRLEPTIEAAWSEHVEKLKKSNSTYEKLTPEELADLAKDERLTVVNRELRRLYQAESEKIKDDVKTYRQQCAIDVEELSDADKRKNAMKNTNLLMKTLLPSLHRETGMIVTVLAAGRSPLSGNINFRSFHVGKGEFGANFAQWHTKWDTAVKEQYVKYFESIEKISSSPSALSNSTTPAKENFVRLLPAEADGDVEEEGEYGDFHGLDGSDEESVGSDDDAPSPKKVRKEGGVNWKALFKANRIMNIESNDDGNSTRTASPSPAPEVRDGSLPPVPNTPPSTASRATSPSSRPAPIVAPAVAERDLDSPSSRPASMTPKDLNAKSPSARKRKRSVEPDSLDPEDIPYIRAAIELLERVFSGRCPVVLENWRRFEELKKFPQGRTRRFGNEKLRPKELTELMEHHDYANLPIPSDLAEFVRQWHAWWRSLQPLWRTKGATWPLNDSRILAPNADRHLKSVSVGGRNGILLAILGVAIWMLAAEGLRGVSGRKAMQEAEEALKDVGAVLQMLLVEEDKENA